MSEEAKKPEYLILFRGTDWQQAMSAEEMQKLTADFGAWFNRLTAEGTVKAGQPLLPKGRIVSGKKGRNVADGPFAESKETIGGYFLLRVDTMEEAVAIAQQCPALEYGSTVEVRPVADQCPLIERARQMQEQELVTA